MSGILIALAGLLGCFNAGLAINQTDTIKIGLLVQDKKSKAAIQGAGLAIQEANRIESSGRFYMLKIRDMEGPWGTGAREAVSLIFSENVWAVIGAADGRNSHLAEQVSAKTSVPFISAWSGDATLGQAFIPWFFSCVPNDEQTASVMNEFITKRGLSKIIIVASDDYDSRMMATAFQKKNKGGKYEVIFYNNKTDLEKKSAKISGKDCIIFFGSSIDISALRSVNNSKPALIIAPCLLMAEDDPDLNYPGEIFVLDHGKTKLNAPAAYAYDAVNIVIRGIKESGNDRASLYKNISKLKYNGITGEISFDGSGNRKVVPGLVRKSK